MIVRLRMYKYCYSNLGAFMQRVYDLFSIASCNMCVQHVRTIHMVLLELVIHCFFLMQPHFQVFSLRAKSLAKGSGYCSLDCVVCSACVKYLLLWTHRPPSWIMLGIIWREKSGEEDKNALGTG